MTDLPPEATVTRRDRAEARRRQILDVALRLFAEQGFAGTSTRQIAAVAGITEGLIFHYYSTKADILRAITGQKNTIMIGMRELFRTARGQPAQQVLQGLVVGWVGMIREQSQLVTMLITEAQTNVEVARELQELMEGTIGAMAGYLESRVDAGELRPDLPVQTGAQMFFSALLAFFLANNQLKAEEWQQKATVFSQEMLEIWLRGALAVPVAAANSPENA